MQFYKILYNIYIHIEKRQLWVRPMGGWNSALQAAWYHKTRSLGPLVCAMFHDIYIYIILLGIYFPSHLLSSPFCSLSLLIVTQIRGHIAGSFPPLPATVRALHFYREKISALSSLVDSRRIVLTHARRSDQLILSLFLKINSKSRHGGIRTHGPTLVEFEDYH